MPGPLPASPPESAAIALLHELLGPSPSSIFSILSNVLARDASLPPLSSIPSAAALHSSPALRPSPFLDGALSRLVSLLVAPRPRAEVTALLAEAQLAPWCARARAVRAVAAAAERELEMCAAADMCAAAARGEGEEHVLGGFRYIQNYEWLCEAEARILGGAGGEGAWWGGGQGKRLSGMSVAFCGSGPLPLSAILLHLRFGARVVLVDVDGEAVKESCKLIEALEGQGIVENGALRVVESCAAAVHYARPDAEASCGEVGEGEVVLCDAVVLASLLPGEIKCAVLGGIAGNAGGPDVVLVRSAVDLVDCFAYERTTCRGIELGRMAFRGEWIPRRDASQKLSEFPDVLGFIHQDVLNSVEVFTAQMGVQEQ